jgi:hypothetical protein
MKKILYLCSIFSLFLLVGCSYKFLTADTLPWVGNNPALFVDSFNSQTGGWLTHEDRVSYVGYTQNGFRLWVDLPDYQVLSVPGLNFKDVQIFTRAQSIAGPGDNLYGPICRYQDEGNFYAFVISSDGYYGIIKKHDGIQSLLGLNQFGFSESINRGESVNDILAVCQGKQLALFVNEVELIHVEDTTFSFGDIGLMAASRSQPGADVLFDHIIVMKPSR